MIRTFLPTASIVLLLSSCTGDTSQQAADADTASTASTLAVAVPDFNADTAYDYVARQVAFGPRIPGSDAQAKCADWMEGKLRAFCDTVYRQQVNVTGGDKKSLRCINLIGAIHPAAKRRVLLLAHWDSRPWADEDTAGKDKPILAADDGGSGVAVLLELARVLKTKPLPADLGVDIFFTDVEDYGKDPEWGPDSYCLGTQYWATHPHVPGYTAQWGVLLDMVGGKGSQFPMERSSSEYAGDVHQRVWMAARTAGFASYFPLLASRGSITDDHIYVNKLAHIPTIDIIALAENTESGFPAHWHTHRDTMAVIDRATLKAVGQTLLQAIYESAGQPV